MNDLVKRLREKSKGYLSGGGPDSAERILNEAADEIERQAERLATLEAAGRNLLIGIDVFNERIAKDDPRLRISGPVVTAFAAALSGKE